MRTTSINQVFLSLFFLVGLSAIPVTAAAAVTVPIETFYIAGSASNMYPGEIPEWFAARQQTQRAVADWRIARSLATIYPGAVYVLKQISSIEAPGNKVGYIYDLTWVRPDGSIYQGDAYTDVNPVNACPNGYIINSNNVCEQSGGIPDPEEERGPDCTARGNPCNPGSGNKYQTEKDYSSAEGSFTLTRTYNSLANTFDYATTNSYLVNRDSGLGVGWTYKPQLEINNYPGTSTPAYIRARHADGRARTFSVATGAWITTANNTDRLTQDGTGYTLSKNDGSVERYNLGGQILSVTDRSGKLTQYSYDGSRVLIGITSPFGHTFTFTYSGNHIATLSDPAGRITVVSPPAKNGTPTVAE